MPNQKPMDVRVVLWEIAHLAKAGFYEMKSPMIGNEQKALAILEAFAEEKALLAIQRTAAIGLSLVLEEREACAKAALEYVPPRERTMDLRDNQEICKRIMSRGEA